MTGETNDNPSVGTRMAKVMASTLSAILVGLILASISGGLIAWRAVSVNDTRLSALESWKAEGGRYTAQTGDTDRLAFIAADQREAKTRRDADSRILKEIRILKEAVESCRQYREDHRVESQKGFGMIEQCQRDLERIRKQVGTGR